MVGGSGPRAVEVQGAGAVEGLFSGAHGEPGREQAVFVAVAVGQPERETSLVGRATVAQAHQRDPVTVGQFTLDVGEPAPVAHMEIGQRRPVGVSVFGQSLMSRFSHAAASDRWIRRIAVITAGNGRERR